MNHSDSPNAAASSKLDFTHADSNDPQELNRILWEDRHGKSAPAEHRTGDTRLEP
jgi:hypothetical protein